MKKSKSMIEVFETKDNMQQELQRNVFSIQEDGESPVDRNAEGGYMLDKDSGTTLFLGENAKEMLKNTKLFEKETEVINPRDGSIEVSTDGKDFTFSDSAVLIIGKGTYANVKVLSGSPIVVTIDKDPDWYEKISASGKHKEMSEKLTGINKDLLTGKILDRRFSQVQREKLLSSKLIERVSDKVVKVKESLSLDKIHNNLVAQNFPSKEINSLNDIFWDSMQRKFYGKESGKIHDGALEQDTLDKLLKAKLVTRFEKSGDGYYWKGFNTDNEFREKIGSIGILSEEYKKTVEEFQKTNRAGYDNTGLVWDAGKALVYSLKHKANVWTHEHTEWMINSAAYAGKNKPFTIGVSSVRAEKDFIEPTPFNIIRAKETLHCHPVIDGNKKQTEIYMVTNGKAAILTMQNEKPKVSVLEKGDIAVINPEVTHRIMAIEGKYEHMVFQSPSAFHYGAFFKKNRDYGEFGTTHDECLKLALQALNANKNKNHIIDKKKSLERNKKWIQSFTLRSKSKGKELEK